MAKAPEVLVTPPLAPELVLSPMTPTSPMSPMTPTSPMTPDIGDVPMSPMKLSTPKKSSPKFVDLSICESP